MKTVNAAHGRGGRSLARGPVVFVLVAALVLAMFAADSLVQVSGNSTTSQTYACDTSLTGELGISSPGLCLQQPLQVSVLSSNYSEYVVPVMILQPGSSTAVYILYLLADEAVAHPGQIENVTTSDVPVAMSVPSGEVSGLVTFSNATVLFSSKSVILYEYTVTAAVGSDGYYAVLPPYYYGAYPALAVGASPGALNQTALQTWGYDGMMLSGEFVLPSDIVGTGNLMVVNATVPTTPECPTPACVTISHSGAG